jgi:Protein of unknown function (DUF3887)
VEVAMRPLRYSVPLLLLILLGVQRLAFAQAPDEKRLSITRDVMADFARGDLASVRDRFNTDLKANFTESDLKGVRDELEEVAGAFQSQISQSTRRVQGAPVYVSKSQFERFKVELRLMFDDADQITYLRIAPVSDLSPESMEAAARTITDLLRQGHFDEVNAKFNDRMKEAMPTERLQGSWVHVMMHLGAFKSIRTVRKDPESDRVDVRCQFENGPMIVRIAFEPSGKIEGLWMLPAETEKDSQI